MSFKIIGNRAVPPIPLLVHIPHSSTFIPPDIRQTLCLSDDALRYELLNMTDWYTERLFNGAVKVGGTLFVNRMSRLVVDPERFPDEDQEIMAAKGMGAIYTTTADGGALRHGLSIQERNRLLEAHFYPYAQGFAKVVSKTLKQHGRCVILDCHSFPSKPLPYELDQRPDRPQVCVGTDTFHTPEWLRRGIHSYLSAEGLSVEENRPFSGTYVPLTYWHSDPWVSSIMIEIRRDLYMNEQTGEVTADFDRISRIMQKIVTFIQNHCLESGDVPDIPRGVAS